MFHKGHGCTGIIAQHSLAPSAQRRHACTCTPTASAAASARSPSLPWASGCGCQAITHADTDSSGPPEETRRPLPRCTLTTRDVQGGLV